MTLGSDIFSSAPFEGQIIGGPQGDPAVFVRVQNSSDAFLFDCGDLGPLSHRELLKVRYVLLSHTHVDHFIGFDKLLRVNIPHKRLLTVFGPAGTAAQVAAKYQAYTWNLLDQDQIIVEVWELDRHGRTSRLFELRSSKAFVPELKSESSLATSRFRGVTDDQQFLFEIDGYQLSAVILDHGIDVCAYSLTVPGRLHVKVESLKELSLSPGQWIKDLQSKIAMRDGGNAAYTLPSGMEITLDDAETRLFDRKPPTRFGYITDAAFSSENVSSMQALVRGAEILVMETNYMAIHADKARQKKHLTTRQAALLAVSTQVKHLVPFHVSAIYPDGGVASLEEAAALFAEFATMTKSEIEKLITREVNQ